MTRVVAAEEGLTIGDFEVAREVAELIEVAAIVIIVTGVVVSLTAGLIRWFREDPDTAFMTFKRYMARGLLIGLDLLIAADVIKTVTLEGTLESAVIISSVKPSLKYSCSGSPLILENGSTAIEGLAILDCTV